MPQATTLEAFGTVKADSATGQQSIIVERLIAAVEAGVAPWQKPWSAEQLRDRMPRNGATGRAYTASNAFWLWLFQEHMGVTDGRWMTYKQSEALGYQVAKGSKGVPIIYMSTFIPKEEREAAKREKREPRSRSFLRTSAVFHASDIEGIPALDPGEIVEDVPVADVLQRVLDGSGAHISHRLSDDAHYVPGLDLIRLPERSQFSEPAGYAGSALHELAHWTGHKNRLNRFKDASAFGSFEYAQEELIAEVAAFLTASMLGIDHNPDQTAAYLSSWSKVVNRDDKPKAIRQALTGASKAANLLGSYATAPEVVAA